MCQLREITPHSHAENEIDQSDCGFYSLQGFPSPGPDSNPHMGNKLSEKLAHGVSVLSAETSEAHGSHDISHRLCQTKNETTTAVVHQILQAAQATS